MLSLQHVCTLRLKTRLLPEQISSERDLMIEATSHYRPSSGKNRVEADQRHDHERLSCQLPRC